MVGDVMILREQSSSDLQNSGDFLEPCFPVRHVVQYREVEDRIECLVLVWKIRDVTFYDSHSISIFGKSTTGSLDHLRVDVDRSNATRTEILNLSYNAFARPTADVEDLESLGSPA